MFNRKDESMNSVFKGVLGIGFIALMVLFMVLVGVPNKESKGTKAITESSTSEAIVLTKGHLIDGEANGKAQVNKTEEVNEETHGPKYQEKDEKALFGEGYVEINGHKISYDSINLSTAYEELSAEAAEQMMYRAVTFYTYVYLQDYEGMELFTSDDWVNNLDEISQWRLKEVSDKAYPIDMTPPVAHDGFYTVHMKISEGLWALVTFNIDAKETSEIIYFNLSDSEIGSPELFYWGRDYGYDYGWYMEEKDGNARILLNRMDDSTEKGGPRGLELVLDANHQVISEEAVHVAEGFEDYYMDDRMSVAPEDLFIVAVLYKPIDEGIKSLLVAIPKINPAKVFVIGSYEYAEGSQDIIPVTIAFTLEKHDDGLLYQDVDGYYKMNYPMDEALYSCEKVIGDSGYTMEDLKLPIQETERMDGHFLNIAKLGDATLRFDMESREFVIE